MCAGVLAHHKDHLLLWLGLRGEGMHSALSVEKLTSCLPERQKSNYVKMELVIEKRKKKKIRKNTQLQELRGSTFNFFDSTNDEEPASSSLKYPLVEESHLLLRVLYDETIFTFPFGSLGGATVGIGVLTPFPFPFWKEDFLWIWIEHPPQLSQSFFVFQP